MGHGVTHLSVERLEGRDTPNAAFVGGGDLRLDSGQTVHPFGDWFGWLNVSQDERAVYVGPGPGGGPRGAVLDPSTGSRIVGDRFFGEDWRRDGLVVIPAGELLPPPSPASVTVGSGHYAVYLEGGSASTVQYVGSHYAPVLGSIRVTNEPPTSPVDTYTTVHFNVPHETLVQMSGGGVPNIVGLGQQPGHTAWVQYSGGTLIGAQVAAHEAGHTLGLGHRSDDPHAIMAPVIGDETSPLTPAEIQTILETVK